MSILVKPNTKVLVQGITGSFGAKHAQLSIDYGTQIVAGVTPGKGGQFFEHGGKKVPIFDTVADAVKQTGATANSTPDKPIIGRSARALTEWLEAASVVEGPIFRRIWKNRVGPALSPASVGKIVQRRAKLAGLEGNFGGHSLRSGFITEAGKQGVSLPAVMAMTEHRSVASVVGYFQAGQVEDNPAARLLK